jgi:hypothetical protein
MTRRATDYSRGTHARLWCAAALTMTACFALAYLAPGGASAASTRAEYIAQADPICQSFVGPMGDAWAAYNRNARRAERHVNKGTYKSWVRLVRLTAASLERLAQIRTSMIDQIAALPSPPEDAQTIVTWLNYLRQEAGFETSAARALRHLKFAKANDKSVLADKAENAAKRTISGFGFQVCGNPALF